MTRPIRIAVAGGGLIAQVEHLPNLVALRSRFELVAVSDPSAKVRAAIARRFAVSTVKDPEALLEHPVDALLVAAPDPWHGALAHMALDRGLHLFCEKPLCYGTAEIDALIAARNRAGVVAQVGYMKRFDPAYEAARSFVRGRGPLLRYVSVEVRDPDAWPYIAHQMPVAADDLEAELRSETHRRRSAQVSAALGFQPDDRILRGFCEAYASALVHDVNAVHGLLDVLEIEPGPVLGAAIFADGLGGHASIDVGGGQALWAMTYVQLPRLADYSERIAFHFDDGLVELTFPSPYLNHHPTSLRVTGSTGHRSETTTIREGYGEAFVRELEGFAGAIEGSGEARNSLEDAHRDQALLTAMARRAAGHPA
jgi:predicted dehydrogenase